ncbi:MAG: magnesium/cobalt transporter CorA [Oscillochloridaceae bacterium umkhey_bin13]
MHTLRIRQGGQFVPTPPLAEISDYLELPNTLIWLDLEAPDEVEVALLSEEFGFHPLAIEDVVRDHERPKIDRYPGYYLLIFYSAGYNDPSALAGEDVGMPGPSPADQPIDLRQLSIFVGRNFLVTIHRRPIHQVRATMQRWEMPGTMIGNHIGGMLHALLDTIVDDYFLLMDQIVDWIEDLEDVIFSKRREGSIEEIFGLKKDLLLLRRVVAPERDLINVLLRQETPIFAPGELVYMQDVYDHIVRVTDSIDAYRELLSSALDSYLSLQGNQLNQLVKTLTLASIILMSASLIAGIYGMNFVLMPELEWPWGYPFALSLMLTVGVGLALFFKSRKWW